MYLVLHNGEKMEISKITIVPCFDKGGKFPYCHVVDDAGKEINYLLSSIKEIGHGFEKFEIVPVG